MRKQKSCGVLACWEFGSSDSHCLSSSRAWENWGKKEGDGEVLKSFKLAPLLFFFETQNENWNLFFQLLLGSSVETELHRDPGWLWLQKKNPEILLSLQEIGNKPKCLTVGDQLSKLNIIDQHGKEKVWHYVDGGLGNETIGSLTDNILLFLILIRNKLLNPSFTTNKLSQP